MKLKHFLPLLLLPALCTSCGGAYYFTEGLIAVEDRTQIMQIGFKDEVTLNISSIQINGNYWLEWDGVTMEDFSLWGTLKGKTVTKINGLSSDHHTLTVTISGDCTEAYAEGRFGVMQVDHAAFKVLNEDLKGDSAYLCLFLTGEETKTVARPSGYEI